jgi:hypothetical protein
MNYFVTLLIGAGAVAIAAACNGSDDPKSGNGVDDVHQSCEIRATWNRVGNDCSLCETAAIAEHCDCSSLKAFSGACLDQGNKRKAACPADLDTCIVNCDVEKADAGATTDPCTCRDACYAAINNPACKKASDDRDGCIAATCADHCK